MKWFIPIVLASLASCVTGSYQREIELERIAASRAAGLEPGQSDLSDCLDALGAPSYVWEYRGDGLALGYAWLHRKGWGVGVSYAVADYASASFNYDSLGSNTKGYLLTFDAEWKLTAVRKGYLRDLTIEFARPRPAPVEE